jgi:hypothetical protein
MKKSLYVLIVIQLMNLFLIKNYLIIIFLFLTKNLIINILDFEKIMKEKILFMKIMKLKIILFYLKWMKQKINELIKSGKILCFKKNEKENRKQYYLTK